MADSQFDILIKFGLSKDAATQAQNELKKIKDESIVTGKEGVNQEKLVEAATQKTFTSKKQLKDMVKQLGHEFPLLGQVGRLALNPIAFTTAAITGAFVLWNKRVQELSTSLGGIEMPDVSSNATDRINAQAVAWGLMAQKMADAANASGQIKAGLADTLAAIKANEELMKAMGIDPGRKGDEARVAATAKAAADLRSSGQARVSRAGTPGSEAAESALGGRFADMAAGAEKGKAEAMSRRDAIHEIGEANFLMKPILRARFYSRYGYDMSDQDAIGLETGNIATQQGLIDSAGRFKMTGADRSVRRGERAGGLADIAQAGKMEGGEVVDLLRQIATGVAGRAPLPTNVPGSLEEQVQFAAAMARFAANLPELTAAIERANAQIRNGIQRP